jgi:hypothetical protein
MCGWNHVFDPYCTQDLHSGQIQVATNNTWGMFFAGHLIIEAILDEMDLPPWNMKNATEILIHGVSAGGIGTWMNADYLANRYPNAKVTLATVCGFYFYATYYTGPHALQNSSMGDFRESAFPETYALYDAFVDESCKQALSDKPWACMLSNYSYPYISTPSFVIQSQTDSVVLEGHCNEPGPPYSLQPGPARDFMQQWHHNMTDVALAPLLDPLNTHSGVFNPACWTHGGFSHNGPFLNNMNFFQAFEAFYNRNNDPSTYKLKDDCGLVCNPSCIG